MTYFVSYSYYYRNHLTFDNVIIKFGRLIKNAEDIDDLNTLIWDNFNPEHKIGSSYPIILNFILL